jgi:hypothetical protein
VKFLPKHRLREVVRRWPVYLHANSAVSVVSNFEADESLTPIAANRSVRKLSDQHSIRCDVNESLHALIVAPSEAV